MEEIRKNHSTGWTWEFLENSLSSSDMPLRFCGSTLLTTVVDKTDPSKIAEKIAHESSSLIRYRLLEVLGLWATLPSSRGVSIGDSMNILASHSEENSYVQEKLSSVISMLNARD